MKKTTPKAPKKPRLTAVKPARKKPVAPAAKEPKKRPNRSAPAQVLIALPVEYYDLLKRLKKEKGIPFRFSLLVGIRTVATRYTQIPIEHLEVPKLSKK